MSILYSYWLPFENNNGTGMAKLCTYNYKSAAIMETLKLSILLTKYIESTFTFFFFTALFFASCLADALGFRIDY